MRGWAVLVGFAAIGVGLADAFGSPREAPPGTLYSFAVTRGVLTMRDGVKLGATYFMPETHVKGERFPVLLEMGPARKDDLSFVKNYRQDSFFAHRGFVCANVDSRGTGSSEGPAPEVPASGVDVEDALQAVEQLAAASWSNGSVGMWGASLDGLLALHVATLEPPPLKAVLVADEPDASPDDFTGPDGVFHVDARMLDLYHQIGLPRPPDYPLDDAYFTQRFESHPGILSSLKRRSDGTHRGVFGYDCGKLGVPAYLIGGLLDGSHDWIVRCLEDAAVPVRAELGPWGYGWPADGQPGPNYEWGPGAVSWWDRFLRPGDRRSASDKTMTVFLRDSHEPGDRLKSIPGRWRAGPWPPPAAVWLRFFPTEERQLVSRADRESVERLSYSPGYGLAMGPRWGESPGDMRGDDAGSLVFDTPALGEGVGIEGSPRIRLRAFAAAPLNWVARLEDVEPDGAVSLVTAGLGGARSEQRSPEAPAGQTTDIAFDLHYTTWTFPPGHRIRLAIGNAQFPMAWPTPLLVTSLVYLGEATSVEIPTVRLEGGPALSLPIPQPREWPAGVREPDCPRWPEGARAEHHDLNRGLTQYEWHAECSWETRERVYRSSIAAFYEVTDGRPGEARFRGDESTRIERPGRSLEVRSVLEVHSDSRNFYPTFVRRVFENDDLVRERQWSETLARQFQ